MTASEITAAPTSGPQASPRTNTPCNTCANISTAGGALTTAAVTRAGNGATIWVAGAATHRQRPATAGGITFLNLEDETGMLNIVVTQCLWDREQKIVRSSPALLVHGVVQSHQGVTSLSVDHFEPLGLSGLAGKSRDFR
ncbi:OB-fold nucleic acid binding domain-containing protein [Amycolatopsis sp. TNS106]|uniref:OB-fold nucleic acid binding domain-containing protein n=1 Tax=Amycolatopsis sp. TNS106 TaxID=2861750 RepID=UPI001C57DED9|nr:OB-fold nucleic acid binding domain-containing protein [Amycolatopsis sp. TNS106]QXV56602.1 hypothetical protein CVV72_05925 [Amycolatopsis sp. TNS106]